MKGKVALINPKRGMASLITVNEEYTTFVSLGHHVDIGDIISGDLESLGGETWYNETQMEGIDVFVEDIYGAKATALKIIS
ncbi:MAG: hypothetical protein QTN59_15030 [Candidatus Electrothrix communis]|nr:MAG: hypothetical protein QTN59_15030 [Candidatus Electrothrix communis]